MLLGALFIQKRPENTLNDLETRDPLRGYVRPQRHAGESPDMRDYKNTWTWGAPRCTPEHGTWTVPGCSQSSQL
jgi:hypothetical protein